MFISFSFITSELLMFVNAVFDLCYSPELQKNALALLNALFTKASPEKKRVGAFPVQYLLVSHFMCFKV